jgi:predicted RNA binding protein YcfA (HicA-like mRNA interferase family)
MEVHMAKASKALHFGQCKTPDDILDYIRALRKLGVDVYLGDQTGSHISIIGPHGSVPMAVNHSNKQLDKGLLGRMRREFQAAGIPVID